MEHSHRSLCRKAEQILNTFERKILRRIFGPICEEGEWRRRYNRELYELYQDVDVVRKAKTRRLHWLGHIERMDNNAPAKRIFESQPPGSRRQGRPNLRFKDQAIADARALGVENWKQRAQDRKGWKAAVSQAGTLHGLRAR